MRRAEHAALVVELLDRHHRAEALLAAGRAVLAGRVHRQADDQRLALRRLRPRVVDLPRPEERGARRCPPRSRSAATAASGVRLPSPVAVAGTPRRDCGRVFARRRVRIAAPPWASGGCGPMFRPSRRIGIFIPSAAPCQGACASSLRARACGLALRLRVADGHDQRLRGAHRRRPASGTAARGCRRRRSAPSRDRASGSPAWSVNAITGTPRLWQSVAASTTSGE